VRVFFDNNISPAVPRAIQELFKGQHEVIALREKYRMDISDVEWIRALDKEGRWIIISGDRRITKNQAEQSAFRSSKLIGMFLSRALQKAPAVKLTIRLLELWPSIEDASRIMEGGTMLELPERSLRLRPI
jgi:hypothetical protein